MMYNRKLKTSLTETTLHKAWENQSGHSKIVTSIADRRIRDLMNDRLGKWKHGQEKYPDLKHICIYFWTDFDF